MIETTLNISLESYNKISQISAFHEIRIKKLINDILHECIKKQIMWRKEVNLFKPVQYQKKNYSEQEWKIIHVSIPEPLYESCLDYRKLYKVSVSSVLEWGIANFLEIIIKIILCINQSDNQTDNYRIEFKLKTYFNINFTELSYHGSIKIKPG